MNTKLYETILNRRSIRRYEPRPLSSGDIVQIEKEITRIKPLHPENHFTALIKNTTNGEDLATLVGGYGKLLSPPHYLVPSMTGNSFALADLGFCTERLVLHLTSLDAGTCYVGTIGQEEKVRNHFQLDAAARVGALVAFGRPAKGVGRAINSLIRKGVGATNKLPAEKIFFMDTFNNPGTPSTDLAPIIEAARLAPSAVNAQPWRLLWTEDQLFLFVTQTNSRYPASKIDYRLYDGGICMANISVALEAIGQAATWRFLAVTNSDIPPHPENIQPLASIKIP